MAYRNFTLEAVVSRFQLEITESANLFSEIEPVALRSDFAADLARNVQLASAINTEKAKSELIVAPVLVELREQTGRRISLFSGIDFSVDAESELTGVCDFLISLSPVQHLLQAPVLALVEAKKDDLTLGLGQCAAEMIAAQRFNAEKGNDISWVYGCSTTGTDWKFLKLAEKCLHIDMELYPIRQCDNILGILASMVAQQA
ncbi:hypothetical protein C6495_02675 [Candidatus Poribacteria bacterium]|nr:MAG: hypothetical protein C6495_02675 [Candidatus Poribacteria bacterium]